MSGLIAGALKGLGEGLAFVGKTNYVAGLEAEKAKIEEAKQARILEAQQKFQTQRDDVNFERELGKVALQDQLAGARDDKKIEAQKELNEADNKSRERVAGMRASVGSGSGGSKFTGTQLQTLLNSTVKEIAAIDRRIKDSDGSDLQDLQDRRQQLMADVDEYRSAIRTSVKLGDKEGVVAEEASGLINSARSAVNPKNNALAFLPGATGETYRAKSGQTGNGTGSSQEIIDYSDYLKKR